MSSSVLEQIRTNHELAELYEQAVCAELDEKPTGQKAKTSQQHKIANFLDHLTQISIDLEAQYDDKDGILKEELGSIRGSNMFSSFYDALNATREYHLRFPLALDYAPKIVQEEVNVPFSGEEIFGKYLDLHAFYLQYSNLANVPARDQDYLQYLDKFNSFFFIPESAKTNKHYSAYVDSLWDYLVQFFSRVQPLIVIDFKEWREEFEAKWAAGQVPGWKARSATNNHKGTSGVAAAAAAATQPLRLGLFNHPSELEALGMDRLKEALEAMGLKCGGSLKDRAERLWSVRGKKPEEIPEKLKAKPKNNSNNRSGAGGSGGSGGDDCAAASTSNGNANTSSSTGDVKENIKEVAWSEYRIVTLTAMIADVVSATRKHTEKQQARTLEEKEAEIREEEQGLLPEVVEDEEGNKDDDDDGPIYNPLNLPLGWDGKPIPYWLYKLHGLGVEYKCEICGNQSYWGRRAFDRHFQEWRHAHGMRCLGIPNTKHFHDITRISDVIALYAKISTTTQLESFVGDVDEEFEDTEGNLLNRRTYEDLARQGLL